MNTELYFLEPIKFTEPRVSPITDIGKIFDRGITNKVLLDLYDLHKVSNITYIECGHVYQKNSKRRS